MIVPVAVAVAVAVAAAAVLAGACVAAALLTAVLGHRRGRATRADSQRRILVPFTGRAIPRRAFDAAVSLALAEHATIVPAFLARVPRRLPLHAPLPAQCDAAMELMETLEQRAARRGVAVDARVSRGRSYRHALRRLVEAERFDRIVVCAPDAPRHGLTYDDLSWLLSRVPAEIMILRPGPEEACTATSGLRSALAQADGPKYAQTHRRPTPERV